MKAHKGFTLIELMVVTVLMGTIMLAVYSVFSSGIKLWQRMNVQTRTEDVAVIFQKLSTDLRSSVRFSGIDFTGSDSQITFPALYVVQDNVMNRGVGEVTYQYDGSEGTLNRQIRGMSEFYLKQPGNMRTLVSDVQSVSFKYYFYDPDKGAYAWEDEWPPDVLTDESSENTVVIPEAVRFEIDLKKELGGGSHVKYVSVPLGG